MSENEKKNIDEIKLETWEEFESKIEEDIASIAKKDSHQYFSRLIFRGHGDSQWSLHTTLERYVQENFSKVKEYSWKDYERVILGVKPAVLSLTNNKFDVKGGSTRIPPGIEFMVYLRHHGFPSPLLDWTASPYVAAYFAYNESIKSENVAIFTFREYVGKGKGGWTANPRIQGIGPYMETHRRHYIQQCEYTICYRQENMKDNIYSYHEDCEFKTDQDILKKYIIPSSERKKVLKKLDLMNINAFSLLGNEEGLMSMLAFRELFKLS